MGFGHRARQHRFRMHWHLIESKIFPCFRNMPVTRSATRSNSQSSLTARSNTRKIGSDENPSLNVTPKRPRATKTTDSARRTQTSSTSIIQAGHHNASTSQNDSVFVPAVLSFSFEDAKQHLTSVDHRFEDLFNKMECKPFQQLERVHPFR
jgi:DNA-3-methyladenine glycosylase II